MAAQNRLVASRPFLLQPRFSRLGPLCESQVSPLTPHPSWPSLSSRCTSRISGAREIHLCRSKTRPSTEVHATSSFSCSFREQSYCTTRSPDPNSAVLHGTLRPCSFRLVSLILLVNPTFCPSGSNLVVLGRVPSSTKSWCLLNLGGGAFGASAIVSC